MKEKKAQVLAKIECLDLKEKKDGLFEEQRHHRLGLKDEFQRKVHQEEIK